MTESLIRVPVVQRCVTTPRYVVTERHVEYVVPTDEPVSLGWLDDLSAQLLDDLRTTGLLADDDETPGADDVVVTFTGDGDVVLTFALGEQRRVPVEDLAVPAGEHAIVAFLPRAWPGQVQALLDDLMAPPVARAAALALVDGWVLAATDVVEPETTDADAFVDAARVPAEADIDD